VQFLAYNRLLIRNCNFCRLKQINSSVSIGVLWMCCRGSWGCCCYHFVISQPTTLSRLLSSKHAISRRKISTDSQVRHAASEHWSHSSMAPSGEWWHNVHFTRWFVYGSHWQLFSLVKWELHSSLALSHI